MKQYRDKNIDPNFYGQLRLLVGPEIGDFAYVTVSNDGVERATMYFGDSTPIDPGYKAVCQIINDLGYDAKVLEIELEEGRGSSIEINGGLHKGAAATIYKGKLRIVKLKVKDGVAGMIKDNLEITSRKVDLHHPDATQHIEEILKEMIGPVA